MRGTIERDEIRNKIEGLDDWQKQIAVMSLPTKLLEEELERRYKCATARLDGITFVIRDNLNLEHNLDNVESVLRLLKEKINA